MLTTEEEAKTKLCPEAIGPGDINWVMVPTARMCIGSACMAWRWNGWGVEGDHPDGRFLSRDHAPHLDMKRYGYCGKAGRP